MISDQTYRLSQSVDYDWLSALRQNLRLLLTVVLAFIAVMAFGGSLLYKRKKRGRRRTIIVFTRFPFPGNTKTRLIPALGENGAMMAQLYMTEHLIQRLDSGGLADKDVTRLDVYYNGGTQEQMRYWLERKVKHLRLTCHPQEGEDLGEKMAKAASSALGDGEDYVVIVGCDIPGISDEILSEAFERLYTGADMVLGPAKDGGYYLIGFSSRASEYLCEVLKGMDWGTEQVFRQQVDKANFLGVKLETLNTHLNDVDTIADISVLEQELSISQSSLSTFPQWSVVIPVLNEGKHIKQTLETTLKRCRNQSHLVDIIVSDGGSSDDTVEIVEKFAETSDVPVRVIHSKPGRAFQLRTGVAAATGDYFLFLHGDTILPQSYDEAATHCLMVPGNSAGAFEFGLDIFEDPVQVNTGSWWFKKKMSFLVKATRRRGIKYELPYGDQGLFMSRRAYEAVGGFDEVYLMEDYILVKKLQKMGHVAIATGFSVSTSSRRWQTRGLVKTTGFNQVILMAYACGVHPNTLARWYYGDKLKTS